MAGNYCGHMNEKQNTMTITVESTPKLALSEPFTFLLKELCEAKNTGGPLAAVAQVAIQHIGQFDVFVVSSHIAIHEQGQSTRLITITESK